MLPHHREALDSIARIISKLDQCQSHLNDFRDRYFDVPTIQPAVDQIQDHLTNQYEEVREFKKKVLKSLNK